MLFPLQIGPGMTFLACVVAGGWMLSFSGASVSQPEHGCLLGRLMIKVALLCVPLRAAAIKACRAQGARGWARGRSGEQR
ncbi:hypothetical protein ACTACG_13835 [Pseudomonas syringae]|uniref:hypothetical protein n=1 Tax=Pseudomonas syringae TaxID=317 RepID=UPI000AFA58AD|nr:hypothetical protein [Pseudomonas syringae]